MAFIVQHPKIREIWAADFRDRVVHHLIYRAMRERFTRSITCNWTKPAYYLKADIANFFGSMDRETLCGLVLRHLDEDWLRDLNAQVILHDPRSNAVFRSSRKLFERVPPHKSLLHAPDGKGLPIGNLTSQFYANIYLDELDQFVKHQLRARYYGRYVDDMVLLHHDPHVLNDWYGKIDEFLAEKLFLRLHPGKKVLNRVDTGIDFTGFIIKPGRTYLRRSSLARCRRKIAGWERSDNPHDSEALGRLSHSMNSYLGQLRQVDGYRARRGLCQRVESLFMRPDAEFTKVLPHG